VRSGGVSGRIWLILVLIAVMMAGTAGALSYFKFEMKLRELVTSQLTTKTAELHSKIQRVLMLGLLLPELNELQLLVEREAGREERTDLVDIHDETGRILFSSDRDRIGQALADYDAAAVHAAPIQVVTGDATITIRMPFRNDFDQLIGGLSVRYSISDTRQKQQWMAGYLVTGAVITIGVCGLLSLLGTRLVVGRLEKQARQTRLSLKQIYDPTDASATSPEERYRTLVSRLERGPDLIADARDEVARDAARIVAALRRTVAAETATQATKNERFPADVSVG